MFHSNLLPPILRAVCTQHKSVKVGAISCQQKFMILIVSCLFAGWREHHSPPGSLGMEPKVAPLEIVRYTGFNFQRHNPPFYSYISQIHFCASFKLTTDK
jgi:hypothetical protein